MAVKLAEIEVTFYPRSLARSHGNVAQAGLRRGPQVRQEVPREADLRAVRPVGAAGTRRATLAGKAAAAADRSETEACP